MEKVQVGIIAKRTESGDFYPARSIYDSQTKKKRSPAEMTKAETRALDAFAAFAAQCFGEYMAAKHATARRNRKEKNNEKNQM